VIELEQPLIDLVRERLPLPRGAQVRVRIGDARAVAAKLPAGLAGAADLVVSDVFAGAQTAHLTTVEYYRVLAGLLSPEEFSSSTSPTARARFRPATSGDGARVLPETIVLAEVQTLKGRRFGNLVIAASLNPLPTVWLPRLMAAGPHPAKVAEGARSTISCAARRS
jgi:hypothetical protein